MKNTKSPTKSGFALLACGAALFTAQLAHADSYYNITINTTPLASGVNAPYDLDFQLAKGSTTLGNTATLSNFSLSNASTTASAVDYSYEGGTSSGDMSSSIVLNDAPATSDAGTAERYQQFAVSSSSPSSISFTLDLTNQSTGATPDGFNIFLFDNSSSGVVATSAPGGSDALAEISLGYASGSPGPSVSTFQTTGPTGESGVTVSVTAVPEPSSWAIIALGVSAFAFLRRRRNQA